MFYTCGVMRAERQSRHAAAQVKAPQRVQPDIHGAHQRTHLLDEVTLSAPYRAESQLRPYRFACSPHRAGQRVRPHGMTARPWMTMTMTMRMRLRSARSREARSCGGELPKRNDWRNEWRSDLVWQGAAQSWFGGSCRHHRDVLSAVGMVDGGNCPVASVIP